MNKTKHYIYAHKRKLIALVSDMVRIPTVNPPGKNYEKMASFLQGCCKKLGLKTTKITTPLRICREHGVTDGSKRISLLADWDLGAEKTLHFNGHYDVVPATGNWKTNPFKPVVIGNRLFGRGTEDMKATIACYLFAIEALKKTGASPDINIQVSFVPDEETGGIPGMGYLVDKGVVKADYAVGEGADERNLCLGNKGILWFKITVFGKSAHASTPYKGINSFEAMVELAQRLIVLRKKVERRRAQVATRTPLEKRATMVLGGELSGGTKINTVPDASTFTIDRRILPNEDTKKVKEEIINIIKAFAKEKDVKVKYDIMSDEGPVLVDSNNDFVKTFSKCLKGAFGKKPKLIIIPGGTDLRFLIRKGVPAIGYNAKGENLCHSDNEFVYIDSLLKTTEVFAKLMMSIQ